MSDRVADLMSYGVQTVKANDVLSKIVSRLRRIGHEGYPVLEAGRITGLLTRRDLDRAVEHGLGDLRVSDVMSLGSVTLKPDDPVDLLVQRMVESGWGQIPVVGDSDKVIGIVTRTDLITYWAKAQSMPQLEVPLHQIESVLGQCAANLIELISSAAREQKLSAFIVGGVVRDVLLNRPNLDIDFVVEGDAIAFADYLKKKFGGDVTSFRPFGTAKWHIGEASLPDGVGSIPDHLDFVTARNEFYEQPTALPSVYSGSIKLDLARRDFTINTLAIQISPVTGRLLDFFGGIADLNTKQIRVLHNLSFVDDPTRILRAVRFERRLGFALEQRTAELIEIAKPMLRRITGERLRNEMTLLLLEAEPEKSFRLLQERGILTAIHPDFILDDDRMSRLGKLDSPIPSWLKTPVGQDDLAWLLLLSTLPADKISEICSRLLIGKTFAEAAATLATLIDPSDMLHDADAKPSTLAKRLKGMSDAALFAAWLLVDEVAKMRLDFHANQWRDVRPTTTGNDLIKRGLKPSACFSTILERLTDALIDGEIKTDADELKLLDSLIKAGICEETQN